MSDDREPGQPQYSNAEERAFAEELERRLDVIEQPGYEDPARRDLPAFDLVTVTIVSLALIVLVHLWGY